jgi:hypothetical protein
MNDLGLTARDHIEIYRDTEKGAMEGQSQRV